LGHRFPQFLPDGHHFLYYVAGSPEVRGIYLGEIGKPESRRLANADTPAVYGPSGHLLFVLQGTLFAQSLDPVRLELTGNAHPVAERVSYSGAAGVAALSASAAGPIAYRSGPTGGNRQLVWFDRAGKESGKIRIPESSGATYLSVSPDERRVAMQRTTNGNTDIWLLELGRDAVTRFTSNTVPDIAPIWSPHGDSVAFSSIGRGTFDLFQKRIGAAAEEELLVTDQPKQATDWSRDGRYLLYRSADPKSDWDIWALPFDGDKKPFPVVKTDFEERDAQFSPNGKWIAYQSNESGRFEVYVQPFPGPGSKYLVSTNGGAQVRWSRDGKELFYISLDGQLTAVPFESSSGGEPAKIGKPVALFFAPVGSVQDIGLPSYTVLGDHRFLIDALVEEPASPITVILNWKPH
jgi:dipeptidyl aminopeptidase/acylaminoacyl peptidase